MSKYQFTPQAVDDRVETAIFRSCDLLADSPFAGTIRKDLTHLPLRFWAVHPYSNYLIVYDPEKRPLQIIRILHGARDIRTVLT
jgi:plasmid stabilization system protein ParE